MGGRRRITAIPGAAALLGLSAALLCAAPGVGAAATRSGPTTRIGAHEWEPAFQTLEGSPEGEVGNAAAPASLSSNWSGFYLASTHTLQSIHGSWTVPSVSASATTSTTGYSSAWIGLGGFSGRGLVQIGTSQTVINGSPTYSAWYESPATTSAVTLHEPVSPGNVMVATVNELSAGSWSLTLVDTSRGWSKTIATTYSGTTSSAEWIVERPAVGATQASARLGPLADYGSVSFTSMQAATTTDEAKHSTFIANNRGTPIISYPWSSGTGLTAPATVTYGTPKPTVDAVTPNHGASASSVTITGTWLLLVQAVHFEYQTATVVRANEPTETTPTIAVNGSSTVVVNPPAGTGGTANVVVVTLDGTTSLSAGDAYTFGTPPASGYDLVGSDGGVFVFPPAGSSSGFYGSLPQLAVTPNAPVVGLVPTKTDNGYFLVAADGGVFSFGTAPFLGSLPGIGVAPRAPITGIVAADTDKGYFLVGRDGGVFAFGTVPYLGSLPGSGVSVDDIVGIASTPTGNGYWLVSQTGTVYAYGAAQKLGTAGVAPVTAIAGTPTGAGYWITSAKGAVQAFGHSTDYATLPLANVVPALPIVAIVPTIGTGGYWLIGSDGGIFNFGDAGFVGSLPGDNVHVDDIVGAVPIG